jgi:hypothetical protein
MWVVRVLVPLMLVTLCGCAHRHSQGFYATGAPNIMTIDNDPMLVTKWFGTAIGDRTPNWLGVSELWGHRAHAVHKPTGSRFLLFARPAKTSNSTQMEAVIEDVRRFFNGEEPRISSEDLEIDIGISELPLWQNRIRFTFSRYEYDGNALALTKPRRFQNVHVTHLVTRVFHWKHRGPDLLLSAVAVIPNDLNEPERVRLLNIFRHCIEDIKLCSN